MKKLIHNLGDVSYVMKAIDSFRLTYYTYC